MSMAIKSGVILAVAVTIVSALFLATGLHQNPIVFGLGSLLLYIAINIAVVFWSLGRTAADNSYGQQLLHALVIGVVGGVLVLLGSWLLLGVVFPDSLMEIREATLGFMQSSGASQAQIDAQTQRLEQMTVTSQAVQGAIGTLLTSLVVGALVSIFKRKK